MSNILEKKQSELNKLQLRLNAINEDLKNFETESERALSYDLNFDYGKPGKFETEKKSILKLIDKLKPEIKQLEIEKTDQENQIKFENAQKICSAFLEKQNKKLSTAFSLLLEVMDSDLPEENKILYNELNNFKARNFKNSLNGLNQVKDFIKELFPYIKANPPQKIYEFGEKYKVNVNKIIEKYRGL